MTAEQVKADLQKYASPERALHSVRFFKTGEGQYGAGDVFIGGTMPELRIVAKKFKELSLSEVQKLLDSEIHEHRMVGLIILTLRYPTSSETEQQAIYDLYLKNVYAGQVNNWDLVDVTAPLVIGEHLVGRPHDELFKLAKSDNLWQRRVAILSSFAFIKRGDPLTTLELAEILLHDKQDLMHKAVGWMLREVGKRCEQKLLTDFLDQHAYHMPRTMLRYSLEKLSPPQKLHYMQAGRNVP
jgi:3-methyladenine DNA glycosylase AlkD